MTASLFTPDLRRILDDLARRIGILERRITSNASGAGAGATLIDPASSFSVATYAPTPNVDIRGEANKATSAVETSSAGTDIGWSPSDSWFQINTTGLYVVHIQIQANCTTPTLFDFSLSALTPGIMAVGGVVPKAREWPFTSHLAQLFVPLYSESGHLEIAAKCRNDAGCATVDLWNLSITCLRIL